MNEKFFALDKEKQRRILNAGFCVFTQSRYDKAPMSEIARQAQISKSLLFHYFHNKKELYLFLAAQVEKLSQQVQRTTGSTPSGNLFDCMERGLDAKFALIRRYPYVAGFAVRAIYEKDPEVQGDIQSGFRKWSTRQWAQAFAQLDPQDYRPGLDLRMMCRQIYWAGEGYVWQMAQQGQLDPDQMEADFHSMLAFWRSVYENPEKHRADPAQKEETV